MKTILLATAMMLASGTCNPIVANPPPGPIEIPGDSEEDAAAPAPVDDPNTQCAVAWAVMADAECAPVKGFEAWMAACAKYPQATIDCVMTVESCASMRNCQGFE